MSQTTLRATGLPPNTEVGFVFRHGARQPHDAERLEPRQRAAVESDDQVGRIADARPFRIPDDLGGWHAVKLAAAQSSAGAKCPTMSSRVLAKVKPKRVKVGETFTVQIKGVGWTELDNTVAVTYDNAAIGYACGFNTNGDVTINLVATGEPGTHLIDLYPAIYRGKDRVPWNYQTPFLTYARDFPALSHGYRLPAYRLAIEIVE